MKKIEKVKIQIRTDKGNKQMFFMEKFIFSLKNKVWKELDLTILFV